MVKDLRQAFYQIALFISPDDGATIITSNWFSNKDISGGLDHADDAQRSFIGSDANSCYT